MPCPKPSPSLTLLLLSWSLGFLVYISYSGLCLASLPPNQPLEKTHHTLPFLSSNLHPSLHPYPPTPGLSWTTALVCWLPLTFLLSVCSLKAEGIPPLPYRPSRQVHPDWVHAQPPGHSWLSLPLHPGAAGLGMVGCCLSNPPHMQLSNLISHITEGLNCLHFYSRCTNLMEWGEGIRVFLFLGSFSALVTGHSIF